MDQKEPQELITEPESQVSEHLVEPADITDEEIRPETASKPRHLKRNTLIALVVVLNLGMAGSSMLLLTHKAKATAGKIATSSLAPASTIAPSQQPASEQPATVKTVHYVSDALKLEFDYPVDWHLSSSASNKYISISSPVADINDETGIAKKGRVQILIYNKYSTSDFQLVDDTGVISAASEALPYLNPADGQRKTTNISFLRYPNDPANSISAFFVSGNLVYSSSQAVNSKNYQAINPFISIYIDGCPSDTHCQGLDINRTSLDTYHNNPILVKTKEIIRSMRFN